MPFRILVPQGFNFFFILFSDLVHVSYCLQLLKKLFMISLKNLFMLTLQFFVLFFFLLYNITAFWLLPFHGRLICLQDYSPKSHYIIIKASLKIFSLKGNSKAYMNREYKGHNRPYCFLPILHFYPLSMTSSISYYSYL